MRNDGLKRTGWLLVWRTFLAVASALNWASGKSASVAVFALLQAKPSAPASDDESNVVNLRRG